MNSSAVSTVIVGTLTDGATLSLIAAGFVVIYRATRVVTFAQGFFMVAGALIFVALDGIGALGLYGSLVIAAVLTGVISAIVFRGVLTRLIGVNHLVTTIATIGIATAGLAVCDIVQGDQTMILRNEPLGFRVIKIAGLPFTPIDIFTIGLAVVVFALLLLGIQRTPIGLRMRAVADRPTLAAYTGISTGRISALAWGLAGATAALAGAAYVLTDQPAPETVYALGLAAFPAILLGGFDSIVGAIVGSLILALIQNIAIYNFSGQWEDVASYGVLLIVLLLRPQGLFGSSEVTRL